MAAIGPIINPTPAQPAGPLVGILESGLPWPGFGAAIKIIKALRKVAPQSEKMIEVWRIFSLGALGVWLKKQRGHGPIAEPIPPEVKRDLERIGEILMPQMWRADP